MPLRKFQQGSSISHPDEQLIHHRLLSSSFPDSVSLSLTPAPWDHIPKISVHKLCFQNIVSHMGSPILDTLQNRLLEIILQGVHQESGKISHGMSETLENLMRDLDLEHTKNSNNSTVKLKVTLDISLPKIYKWLANVKRCSTSLAIRETQVKTTMTTLLHTH